ncbi:MAG: Ig-like domain-containing protein [Corynebacterium sp.]|uniref:L,D-transpeptidase n=1 Tax=Corynebacterium sp. TaxID=1720 RepID=UPI0026E06811|nr:Ig-like domain-containing protein [Corynebacterium sp.]MDO5669044.1 Ig-like domain-containing protein [Corynebacterium sp.]
MMAAVVMSGTLASCTIDTASESEAAAETTTSQAPAPLKVSVKDGAEKVDPSVPVTVTSGTELVDVTMTNQYGNLVKSKLSADKKSWTSDEVLGYNRTYTIVAEDKAGKSTTTTFSTPSPAMVSNVSLAPLDGSEVGVAQTITIRFGTAIRDRQAAQDAVTITTSPKVEGAFYWLNNSELRWRPENFWKPGTKVTVEADIYGQALGGGTYGADNNKMSFTIGDDVRTVVDDATKTMTVYRGEEKLRTIPVSLGRDTERWATPNGTYIVGDQHSSMVMDSMTYGLAYDQGGYKTPVSYATQMSWSGIYVHGAPWSVGDQGRRNVSHGCINVTNEAAQWFMNTVKRGDPVEVKNTVGGTLSGYDGLGDWNIPWSTWKKGNVDDAPSW